MSQAGGNPIGTARIDFTGNVDQLRIASEEAKRLTQEAVSKAEAASAIKQRGIGAQASYEAEKAAKAAELAIRREAEASALLAEASANAARVQSAEYDAFSKAQSAAENRTAVYAQRLSDVESAAKKSTREVLKFGGQASLVAGVAASAFALGQSIREHIIAAFETATEKASKFTDALDFRDSIGSARKLQEEIDSLNSRIGASQSSVFANVINRATGDSISKMEDQRSILEEKLKNVNKFNRSNEDRSRKEIADRAKKEDEAASKARADALAVEYDNRKSRIESLAKEEATARLEGEQRIAYETESKIIEIDRLRKGASKNQLKQLDEIEANTRENARREIDEYRKSQREKADITIKEMERAAKQLSQAFDQLGAKANALFNPNTIDSGVGTIIAKIDLIAQQLRRQV